MIQFFVRKSSIGQFVDTKKAISFLCMALVRHPNTLAIELEYIFGCQRLERIHRCNSTHWGISRERWCMVWPVHCIPIDNLDHNQGISRSEGISRWSYCHHLHKKCQYGTRKIELRLVTHQHKVPPAQPITK